MQTVIVGGGNMGRSLLGGLLQSGVPAKSLVVIEPGDAARSALAGFAVTVRPTLEDSVNQAETVVLAVKPATVAALARSLAGRLGPDVLVVSIAAGVTTQALTSWLGARPLVRAMPNTPALVGAGMSVLYALPATSAAARGRAEAILAAVGKVAWITDESLMDAVTAVSGSGPAYFFLVMEAMELAAVELGLPLELARTLIQQTALGSALMAKTSAPGPLRAQVTSPGGTTERAIVTLQTHHLEAAFKAALGAATLRSRELAEACR